MADLLDLGQAARRASVEIARANTAQKNACLLQLAQLIEQSSDAILNANKQDLTQAAQANLSPALLDRLTLKSSGVAQMCTGLRQIVELPDPIGTIEHLSYRPSGIQVGQMRVPLGVIGIIYESRPNVTIDAAALCIKSGNASILRGGSEAFHCNQLLMQLIQQALQATGLPQHTVQLVPDTDRARVTQLAQMNQYVDVIVPRGGKGLIERLMKEATVPMIKHLDGICHVYVDTQADLNMACEIAFNAKCQRYGTCNTMETLVVAQSIAAPLFASLAPRYAAQQVQLRADPIALALLQNYPLLTAATEEDWRTEYLAPILAIKVVAGLDEAIEFINRYSSQHTDSIVTAHHPSAMRFLREVDSASVIVNASTRFADGFEYGLGAEIGISNDKLHARGPVGLLGLTSLKYIVLGQGEIRQ